MLEKIVPKDRDEWLRARVADVTSTEISALFGLSPYTTEYELWHWKKQGVVPPFEENVRMRWGKRLEPVIAAEIAATAGWTIRPMPEYWRHTTRRMGASFDFAIVSPETEGRVATDLALLEIKNVDGLVFRNEWIEGENGIEAPPHIELQVQHQLALTGLPDAYIGVLVGGNDAHVLHRKPDTQIHDLIYAKVANFWVSQNENRAPSPDFKRDAKFIASLYRHAEPNSVYDGELDADLQGLAEGYRYACDQEKAAKLMKDTAKAKILMKIGTAEKALGQGYTISAGVRGPVVVPEHERAGFRDFRVHWKKIKEGSL